MKNRILTLFVVAVTVMCVWQPAVSMQRDTQRNPERAAMGKLGQAKGGAKIYVAPSVDARVLNSNVNEDTYVVIRKISGEWVTLVMADGTDGFMLLSQLENCPTTSTFEHPNRLLPRQARAET